MIVEQFVLKEKLKEIIGNRQVMAALFYTFNFDPRFFENYVMPLFVGNRANDFRDEIIHNKILWRTCIKEGLVPPITVYCDYFAKDNTEAPSLGYEIYCVKVRAAVGKICNFHPKHIFILLKDEGGYQSLLVVTGSGNITPSGWCDNFECFSIEELGGNRSAPNRTSTNLLQNCISRLGRLAGPGYYTEAESLIDSFLRYEDFNHTYFNSINQSFTDFLEDHIPEDINELEIISPYFSNDTGLIEHLKNNMGLKKIKCLIPTLKDNEIQLSKQIFLNFKNAGIEWSHWAKLKVSDKTYDRTKDLRNIHAKIYRFYSNLQTFTIVGSVNFTNPAWSKYQRLNNQANIESAWLYIDNYSGQRLLKPAGNLDPAHFRFIEKETLENNESSDYVDRNAPDIEFVIDWKTKKLEIKVRSITGSCSFKNILSEQSINKRTRLIDLDQQDIKTLTKNTLIEVVQKNNNKLSVHSFYPRQTNIEMKPLDFRLSAINILQYWDYLGDHYQKDVLTRTFAEKITDGSGIVNENKFETKSLLNEMAAHFNGLIKLENYLFPDYIQKVSDRREQFKTIKHFLLTESIDTLPFYIENLPNELKDEKIKQSFYWMIIQIVLANIYFKASRWIHRHDIDRQEWKSFKKDLGLKTLQLRQLAKEISKDINCPEKNLNWVEEQLKVDYDWV